MSEQEKRAAPKWSEQWMLASATTAGAADAGTVALLGPVIYGDQRVEVVPKLEAEQQIQQLRAALSAPQEEGEGDTIQVARRDSDRVLWARRLPNGDWYPLDVLLPAGSASTQRWTIWRVERGEGMEPWTGVRGPATNPSEDLGLTAGADWCRASEVEVIPAAVLVGLEARIAAELRSGVALEDEDGPVEDSHYDEIARNVVKSLSLTQQSVPEHSGEGPRCHGGGRLNAGFASEEDCPGRVDCEHSGVEKAVEEAAELLYDQFKAFSAGLWCQRSETVRDHYRKHARKLVTAIQSFLVQPACSACGGSGEDGNEPCGECNGSGKARCGHCEAVEKEAAESEEATIDLWVDRFHQAIAEFEERAEGCRQQSTAPEPFVYAATYLRGILDNIGAASPQPESGGVEAVLRERLAKEFERRATDAAARQIPDLIVRTLEDGADLCRTFALTQPVLPPPQLSDEDRERLKRIVRRIEQDAPVEVDDVDVLRKLASQPIERRCLGCGNRIATRHKLNCPCVPDHLIGKNEGLVLAHHCASQHQGKEDRGEAVPVVRAEPGVESIIFELECGHDIALARSAVEGFNESDELELPTALVCPACALLSLDSSQPQQPEEELDEEAGECACCGDLGTEGPFDGFYFCVHCLDYLREPEDKLSRRVGDEPGQQHGEVEGPIARHTGCANDHRGSCGPDVQGCALATNQPDQGQEGR